MGYRTESVFPPSVSVGVWFQFTGTDNFVSANIFIVSANIFIVGDNFIVVSCMYLTLFTCTLKGAFNCQYYILLAPTTVSDTILFHHS